MVISPLDHEDLGSNPNGNIIQLLTVQCLIAQSLSLSPFHCQDMT